MSIRTSGAQLPSATELFDILDNESPRMSVNYDYVTKHADIFDAYKQLCDEAGARYGWIDRYPSTPLDSLLQKVDETLDVLKPFIRNHPQYRELYADVFNGLVLSDDTTPSDMLFVFGAGSNARIERAVELFHQGISHKIVISGNRPFYGNTTITEAARMAEFAIAHGVPADALILEDTSITLPDNVKRTLDLFESRNLEPQSMTYVITNYAMRRAYMEWYKFTPWPIDIRPVAARTVSLSYSPDSWFSDGEVLSFVLNEYVKLIVESKMDLIRTTQG